MQIPFGNIAVISRDSRNHAEFFAAFKNTLSSCSEVDAKAWAVTYDTFKDFVSAISNVGGKSSTVIVSNVDEISTDLQTMLIPLVEDSGDTRFVFLITKPENVLASLRARLLSFSVSRIDSLLRTDFKTEKEDSSSTLTHLNAEAYDFLKTLAFYFRRCGNSSLATVLNMPIARFGVEHKVGALSKDLKDSILAGNELFVWFKDRSDLFPADLPMLVTTIVADKERTGETIISSLGILFETYADFARESYIPEFELGD